MEQETLNSGLQGAATGAAMGASVGSIIPGIGTAIGGAVGAIGGGIYGSIQGKKLAAENKKQRLLDRKNRMLLDSNINPESYNSTPTPYYRYGGTLLPISNNSSLAVGNTHEQGGIQLPNGNVENGEVINKDKVYSDVLTIGNTPISKIALSHTKLLAKLERNKSKINDKYLANSNNRKIENVNYKLDELYNQQEQLKEMYNIKNK